jgi:hypothetical protein
VFTVFKKGVIFRSQGPRGERGGRGVGIPGKGGGAAGLCRQVLAEESTR